MDTCRYCLHYDLESHRNKGGKIVVRAGSAAKCMFDMAPIQRTFPLSCGFTRPIRLNYMEPGEGAGCSQWTARP